MITGIFGASKAALITFAPLSGGNDGIQPSIGSAHGNTANHGTTDDSYCVPFDTTQDTIGGQAPLYMESTMWGYRGDSGVPDHDPIDVGPITYGCNPSGSSGNFSPAQLRAIVGYSVTHDLATLSAINAILVA